MADYAQFMKISTNRSHFELLAFHLKDILPTAIDNFYITATENPVTAEFLKHHDIANLKKQQTNHLLQTLTNGFDDAYFKRVARIGYAHESIQLTPDWFITAYGLLHSELVQALVKKIAAQQHSFFKPNKDLKKLPQLLETLNGIAFMDMAVSMSSYWQNMKRKADDRVTEVSQAFNQKWAAVSTRLLQPLKSLIILSALFQARWKMVLGR